MQPPPSTNNEQPPRDAAAIEKMIEDSTAQTNKIIMELALYEKLVNDLELKTKAQTDTIEENTRELASLTAKIESLTTESQTTSAQVSNTQQQIEQYKQELTSILQKTTELKKMLFGVKTPKADRKEEALQQFISDSDTLDAPKISLTNSGTQELGKGTKHGGASGSYNRRNRGSKRRQTHKRKIRSLRRKY